MKTLTRNCLHGSTIYFLEEIGGRGQIEAIFKSSSSQEGIDDLFREIEGFRWYSQHTSQPISVVVARENAHYLSVKYDFIKGKKVSYRTGYFRNRKWIASILEHYCSVWGASHDGGGWNALHGDLSLDNVIFTENGPVFIDWEHFKGNAAPLGFDGLHLLFESLWFESGNKSPRGDSLSHLAEMIHFLQDRKCLNEMFLGDTFFHFIEFIKSNSFLWGAQLSTFRGKLPVLMFSEQRVKSIDKELARLIKS